ncbi:PfkB family carbohydrate kinase [Nocardioides jensenii]|uniref:PfkB family carbohydrate kinase n=1 Tax=Nocardioides jensenii TaxID=1843 RepID=UPI0008364402|nr:PfkB family carbohydrate kinase [Nocardioides jensenii]
MDNTALVVGEALVDVVRAADGTVTEHPGGSAANVAVALSRLGRPTRLATSWAADAYGDLLARHLADNGVGLAVDPQRLARTSTALATIDDTGAARYSFDIAWSVARPADHAPLVLHVCSLGAVLPPGADDVRRLARDLRDKATVTYDVNLRPDVTGTGSAVRSRVEGLVALADVVKASDEDLASLFPLRSPPESAAALLALGPAAVVLTRGAHGATCFAHSGQVQVPAAGVSVVDTIGAGDTFDAGIIDALWSRGLLGAAHRTELRSLGGEAWQEVLSHATAAAAVTVARPGADPPYRHELRS